MNADIAIFPPWCVLMRVFVALEKIKLINDVRIGHDEERALRCKIETGHFAPGTELAVEPLDKDNVVIVDLADTRDGFVREVDPLLACAGGHRLGKNTVADNL